MREIIFRGKRIDNGELVEGDLIHSPDGRVAISTDTDLLDVQNETVSQYTGLTDKSGGKIFEGDILSFSAYGENFKGYVRFIKGNFTVWCGKCDPFLDDVSERHSATVIGNIFDNPELIK